MIAQRELKALIDQSSDTYIGRAKHAEGVIGEVVRKEGVAHDEMMTFCVNMKAVSVRDTHSGQGGGRSDVREAIDPSEDLIVKELKDGMSKEDLIAWRNSFDICIESELSEFVDFGSFLRSRFASWSGVEARLVWRPQHDADEGPC